MKIKTVNLLSGDVTEISYLLYDKDTLREQGGKLLWDTGRLFTEIVNGVKKCKELNKIPVSMSIDTWAVDYVLLDGQDRILGDNYGYRDGRTAGMDTEVYKIISEQELYQRNGIQKQIFNTIGVSQKVCWS